MSLAAADLLVREGDELLQAERFGEAAARFERAVVVFPQHSLGWRGLGQALLRLGKPHDAARAFDQAIGLRPESATALWGGALAHAETGNELVARDYLRRTIALQPTWAEMALGVPALAGFLHASTRAADCLRARFGELARQRYHHVHHPDRHVDVARIADLPCAGMTTYVTIGLSNTVWDEVERPRVELVLASTTDIEPCRQILANLAFHLTDTRFFPLPGSMVRDVVASVKAGELSTQLPHIYVQSPRAWRIALPLDEGPPAITLAQVFPVSEHEYQQWKDLGSARFEELLAARDIDIADLRRAAP
jgi:hypothetical protein